jgi:hypothetical protein
MRATGPRHNGELPGSAERAYWSLTVEKLCSRHVTRRASTAEKARSISESRLSHALTTFYPFGHHLK